MDIALIESKYADLKRAFEQDQIGADEYQMAVDDLRTQDDYGRYWIIGAETGEWYYYDGVEWISADPVEADKLPFVDENGVYWMLGQETNEWYFYDGESWVRPETESAQQEPSPATPSQEQTQYYEDEQGRYWAKGAKSGQWYYYDETGWHKGDDLPEAVPPAAVPDYRPSYQRPAQPDYTQTVPFQPIQPSPSYLHQQTPMQAVQGFEPAAPQPQQPAPQPQAQPDYTKPVAPQPQPTQEPPQPSQAAYTQPVSPQQPQPAQGSVTPPAQAQLEAGVWYYSDGEQWLRYQDTPNTQAETKEETPSVEDQLEANVWYYFDGEQWLAYQDIPDELEELTGEAAPLAEDESEARQDEDYIPEDEEYFEDDEILLADNEIEIDDLDDFVEVIEVDEDDIIDLENDDLIEAEFQVEILKPGQPEAPIPAAAPVIVEAAPSTEERLTTQPVTPAPVQGQPHEPVPMEFASTHEKAGAKPKVAPQPQPAQKGSPVQVVRALPMWLWSSLGGITTLIIAGLLIVGTVYLLNNREKGVALITAQLTPTLPAAVSQTTPTPASTPTPTATVPPTATSVPLAAYTSNYFGLSMKYPAGWVLKEDDDLVIFAPSARALDRTTLAGASLWISLADNAELTELLAGSLEEFSPISETLSEGIMNIGRQSWASAQVRFDSETMGTEVIALVASTVINDRGYTLIAAAPASEWEDYKPLFQYAIDSFEFSTRSIAAGPSDATDDSTPVAETDVQTPTTTATPTKAAAAEPVIYVVQSGDTLGGIAYRYDVSVADLVKANGLSSESAIINIGQELIIPQEGVEVAAVTATATPKTANTPKVTSTPGTTVTPTATAGDEGTVTPKPAAEPTATTAPATTTLSGRIVYPAFSTDILSFNIWSTKVDGSDPLIVAGNASQPQYNSNGSLFAYRSWAPNKRGIYFIDLVGGRQGLLTGFIEDALPAWYNDGTLVFTSRREGDRVPRLFRVGQEVLNGYSLGFNSDYVETLADNRLVARGCSITGDCGLWVLLPDGSGETKISDFSSDTAPSGKPQGGRIALMSLDRGSAGNWEIWTINEDGSNPVRLTEDGANDGLPVWSPDGNSIAFVSDRGGVWAIWAMNADGSNQRKLFNMQGPPDGQVLHDVPNSRGWLEERLSWIP